MPETTETSAATYDAVPYSVSAFRQTDPDRLAVLARVFGLASAPPQKCRVLELGCASGGNIIPMALAYPDSHFVGIDLSQRQIADGVEIVRELNLPNMELLHLSITDVTPAIGQFDYILAHGVYSWVPPFVQEKILDICRDNLTPTGVAYISYNTYPGWHTRRAIREMLLHHTAAIQSPVERIKKARELLTYIRNFHAKGPALAGALLVQEIDLLLKTPDTYILHEYLEDCNEPLYFHQFAARAKAKNLQYLAEAEIASMLPDRFGLETGKSIRAMSADFIELEQNMDFHRHRMFRQTLLCHEAIPLDHKLRADAVTGFHLASPLKPESVSPDLLSDKGEAFVDTGRPKLTVCTPILKAALLALSESWPLPIPFSTLLERARSRLPSGHFHPAEHIPELTSAMLNCFTAGVVEFSVAPPGFVTKVSDHPTTSRYVRLRARLGAEVTNLRLDNIEATEASRLILTHLDGQHSREDLIRLVDDWMQKTLPPSPDDKRRKRAAEYIDYILKSFATSALLTA